MKNKKILILIALVMMISLVGISYAFFEYYKEVDYRVTAGEVTLNFNEGTNTINLTNIFPEKTSDARKRTDNFITFTVSGANTTTNKDIWYEIMLNNGDEETGKTRFDPDDLRFDLSEVNSDGTETMLVGAMSYDDFNERRIWVNSIVKGTTTTSTKTYKLRMWLSGNVVISDTESYADYTSQEFRNSYASVKVSVYGDFEEKELPYSYMVWNGISWVNNEFNDQAANITSVNFVKMDEFEMTTRYNASTIKDDFTNTKRNEAGSVLAWLEANEDDSTKYTMYVASKKVMFLSSGYRMFEGYVNLVDIRFENIKFSLVTDMEMMFRECSSLTSLDVSDFDTSKVTDMSDMFIGCSGLTSLDVSGFDTAGVTNMSGMFLRCSGLTSLDVSGFDTSNVIDMSDMFAGCSSLTSLDVSGFETGAVTNMSSMFHNCSNLTSLDVSGFETGAVTSMSYMFYGCSGLTSLDVGGFDTGGATSMSDMFYDCSSLTSLDVGGFDTSNVTDMGAMFCGCSNLTSLDVSGFDTGGVTNMSQMFRGCSNLTSLDVSGFETGAVTSMSSMFYSCSSLTTIYSNSDWNTGNVTSSSMMFWGSSKLVGAISYSGSKIDVTYANPTTGYFTAKPAEETPAA